MTEQLRTLNAKLGAFTDWAGMAAILTLAILGKVDGEKAAYMICGVASIGAFQNAKGKPASVLIPLAGFLAIGAKKIGV